MDRALYSLVSGSEAEVARIEMIANNLANAGTAGFKGSHLVFGLRPLVSPHGVSPTSTQVVSVEARLDASQGAVVASGNPLDLALSGPGFFVVRTPAGERYTRQGTFMLDANGYLTTPEGYRVQGEGGDLLVSGRGQIKVGTDGTIRVGEVVAGRLDLVDFPDPARLRPEGTALLAAPEGGTPFPAGHVHVRQGYVEQSNVDATREMVALLVAARGFESYIRALERIDSLNQRSINDVGRV